MIIKFTLLSICNVFKKIFNFKLESSSIVPKIIYIILEKDYSFLETQQIPKFCFRRK